MALDLCLDDFNDEDLSDILQDKDLHLNSYANDSFKIAKRRATGRRSKRTTSDSVVNHSNLNYSRPQSMHEIRSSAHRRPRPTSLKFFAEPARPGPLVKLDEPVEQPSAVECDDQTNTVQSISHDSCKPEVVSRLRESYSEETIKNNNVKQSESPEKETNKLQSSPKPVALCTEPETDCQNTSDSAKPPHENEHRNFVRANSVQPPERRYLGLTRSASEWSIEDPDRVEYCYLNGELKEQTHTASFKFVPRHADEIHLEINDPLHVFNQADDFWYEGINMRTGQQGIFPAYYAQSLFGDMDDVSSVFSLKEENCERFNLYFLGSVEVAYHKGNDILCEAMRRVALARRNTLHKAPPAYICLLVNAHGIKMMDQSQMKQAPQKPFSSSVQEYNASCEEIFEQPCARLIGICGAINNSNATWVSLTSSPVRMETPCCGKVKERTHFFQLRNVSFCGQHPRNDKYFAFITRHPDFFSRFACHVFVSETSTRPLAESVGRAFTAFYREFMECAHPAEDIYIE